VPHLAQQSFGAQILVDVGSRKSMVYKDFTGNSFKLKDLAEIVLKSLIPKDREGKGDNPKAR
jgi:hypothetical protein